MAPIDDSFSANVWLAARVINCSQVTGNPTAIRRPKTDPRMVQWVAPHQAIPFGPRNCLCWLGVDGRIAIFELVDAGIYNSLTHRIDTASITPGCRVLSDRAFRARLG